MKPLIRVLPWKPDYLRSVVIAVIVLLGVAPLVSRADYYKYKDKNGILCITNTRDSVPPKYRATMKVVREETLDKRVRTSRITTSRGDTSTPAPSGTAEEQKQGAPAVPPSTFDRFSDRFPWLKPVIVVCVILSLFLIVRRLSALLPSALFARLIYLSFFIGVFVFVFKSYADHLSNGYFTVKTKLLALFENVNKREIPEIEGRPPSDSTEKEQLPE